MLSRFFEKNGGENGLRGAGILHGAKFFRVRDSARRGDKNKYANIDKP